MSPPDPDTVRGIFAATCSLPDDQRDGALRRLCGGDAALRAEVEALLASDSADGWLDEGDLDALRGVLRADADPARTPLPAMLGDYRIEGLLGRGGVGVVYLARQVSPDRQVALKVLPPSSSPEATRRFALEQETLARLQHPAIAQIYAAGTFDTDAGPQPYLAMELVAGRDLQRWCAARQPGRRQRIELLIAICEAVHHAHQKGVVHRDLKPGNILIDAQDRPKVVDFGLARLLEDVPAQMTVTGQVLGTPAYMSPEQADGRSDLIDTRTDVYALGVVGYQLLSGRLPIDVVGVPVTRAIRRVVEDEPVPLGRHAAALRGDLQNIVARCLGKRPEQRYSSAMALAEDLRRHLAHEPVSAREPSRLYVLQRFARRHRLLLGAAVLVFAALSTALWVSLDANAAAVAARREAEAEATEARRQLGIRRAVLEFLSDVFASTDPGRNPDARTMSPGQIFARAADAIGPRFGAEPEVEQAVRAAVGELLIGLGDHPHALEQLQAAQSFGAPAGNPWLAVTITHKLGMVHNEMGTPKQAIERLDGARQRARALLAAGQPAPQELGPILLELDHTWAQSHFLLGDRKAAERIWRALLAEAEATPALADCGVASTARAGLATICAQDGRTAEAEPLVRRAAKALRASGDSQQEVALLALNNLAGVKAAAGDVDGAVQLLREVLVDLVRVFGPNHTNVLDVAFNLAALEWQAGARGQAIARMRELVDRAQAEGLGDSLRLAGPYANLGKMLWTEGGLDEAAARYQHAIDIRLEFSPESDVTLSGYYNDLARIRHDQGRHEESLELLRTSVRIRIEALGPLHPKVLPRRVDLAACELHTARDPEAALAQLRAVDDRLVGDLGPDHFATIYSQQLLAECMLARGDPAQARVYIDRLAQRAERSQDRARWLDAVASLRAQLPR